MQFMIRSCESSSMGTAENLDCPTRMIDVMIRMASARTELMLLSSDADSANRKTSFVNVAARTLPVKKSPPRSNARKGGLLADRTFSRRAASAAEEKTVSVA